MDQWYILTENDLAFGPFPTERDARHWAADRFTVHWQVKKLYYPY